MCLCNKKFFGVKIPETIGLSIVAEITGTFGLVIPAKKN
jgi:hypothetical protein